MSFGLTSKQGICVFAFFGLLPIIGNSQLHPFYDEQSNAKDQHALYLFQDGLNTAARELSEELYTNDNQRFSQFWKSQSPIDHEEIIVSSAIQMQSADAEQKLDQFIYGPRSLSSKINMLHQAAEYAMAKKQYQDAYQYFKRAENIDGNSLCKDCLQKSTALLAIKDYYGIIKTYKPCLIAQHPQYDAMQYIMGLCYYNTNQNEEALLHFNDIQDVPKFKQISMLYQTAIYYSIGKYEASAQAGIKALQQGSNTYNESLSQLVADALFNTKQYKESIQYYERISESVLKQNSNQWFNLAQAYVHASEFSKAQTILKQLSNNQDSLAQHASFLLARSYILNEEFPEARKAFKRTMRFKWIPHIYREAEFQYAKLSAELGYYTEAVPIFQKIPSQSPYFIESQSILSQIFELSDNAPLSLSLIEALEEKSPRIQEAYVNIAIKEAIRLFQDKQYDNSKSYLNKINLYPQQISANGQAHFINAEIAYQENRFLQSLEFLEKYFNLKIRNYPYSFTTGKAYYLQAYNYLKLQEINKAEKSLGLALAQFSLSYEINKLHPSEHQSLIEDTHLRLADCALLNRNYADALSHYAYVSTQQTDRSSYANFRTAMIYGLQKKYLEKLLLLEKLESTSSKSALHDQIMFQQGLCLLDMNKPIESREKFNHFILQHPNSPYVNAALIHSAIILYNQGDLPAAIDRYKQTLSNKPSTDEIKSALAGLKEIYIKDMALPNAYFEIVETIPFAKLDNFTKDSLQFESCLSLYQAKKYDVANKALTDYCLAFPQGAFISQAKLYRAQTYYQLENYSKALDDFEWVIQSGEKNALEQALIKSSALQLLFKKDYKKALERAELLIEISTLPQIKHDAAYTAAEAAYLFNNREKLNTHYSSILLSSYSSLDQIIQVNYWQAKLNYIQQAYPESEFAINKVIEKTKDERAAECNFMLVDILFKANKFDEAILTSDKALKFYTPYPLWVAKSLLIASEIYIQQSDYYNAKAVLETIIEQYPKQDGIKEQAQLTLKRISGLEKK